MAKKSKNQLGKWAFLIGLLLAVLAGIVPSVAGYAYTTLVLVILGLIVGFMNVSGQNTVKLLVAIIALAAVGGSALAVIPAVDTYLTGILQGFIAFVGAAGLVVAVKAILETTKA